MNAYVDAVARLSAPHCAETENRARREPHTGQRLTSKSPGADTDSGSVKLTHYPTEALDRFTDALIAYIDQKLTGNDLGKTSSPENSAPLDQIQGQEKDLVGTQI